MEVEGYDTLPEDNSVIHGHKVCQTRDAKWMCIDNIYQKFHRPNFYDIGGTYIEDVADYWFMYQTEQVVQDIHLLHIFVCNRQESKYSICISQNADMKLDKKNGVVYLSQSLKEYKLKKSKEMTQNYLTTYSFNTFDLELLKDKKLFIAVSIEVNDMNQGMIEQVKLHHDFGALLEDPVGSDFVIESADGAKFHVHKTLLSVQSEVFKAMLKAETAESQNGCVKLIDVGKEDLQYMLESIYTGTIKDLENCNWFNMLMLADKYDIRVLIDLSLYALTQQLSSDNVVDTLEVADMYNCEVLKYAAIKFIKKDKSIIHSSRFKKIKNADLLRQLCEHLATA